MSATMNPRRDSFPRARRPSDENPSPSQVAAGDVVTFVFGKWRKAANLFTKAAAAWKDTHSSSEVARVTVGSLARALGCNGVRPCIQYNGGKVRSHCSGDPVPEVGLRSDAEGPQAGIKPGPQRFLDGALARLFTSPASFVVVVARSIGRTDSDMRRHS